MGLLALLKRLFGMDPEPLGVGQDHYDGPRSVGGIIGAKMDSEQIKEAAKKVGGEIFDLIKRRSGDFLDNNRQAKDFISDRTLRVGELLVEYELEQDETAKRDKKERLELVRSTIDTELIGLALEGSTAAKETFKEIVNTTFEAVAKVVPVLLAAI